MTFPAWMTQAACAGLNPELFFPEPGGGQNTADHAKQVCAQCPVNTDCLTYAVHEQIGHGIWGGKDADERRRLRPRPAGRPIGLLAPINHGTEGGYAAHRRRGETACPDCLAAHAQRDRERAHARRTQ